VIKSKHHSLYVKCVALITERAGMDEEWGKQVGWRNEQSIEHHAIEYSKDHPGSQAQIMSN
jgi:hypothetical protein